MFRKLATIVGYVKAPRTTFILRHPVKGTKALVAARGIQSLVKSKAGVAVGAVAAAVPVAAAAVIVKRRGKEG